MKKIIFSAVLIVSMFANCTTTKASCNHNWVVWDRESATCTTDGYEWYDCSICGDSKRVSIPATGIHKWSEWKADGYLCENGKDTRYCQECYQEETRVRQGDGNHLWSDWERWTEPDCLNTGKDRRECLNCYTDEYRDVAVDKNAHSWSSWSSDRNATVIKKGTISRYCYTCDKKEKKYGKKLKPYIKNFPKKMKLKKGIITFFIPDYATGDKVVKYTSSNKKVASITKSGTLTTKRKGKAVITIKMKSGLKKKCKLTVK